MTDIVESPITIRLKDFINSTGLTVSQFADKAGIPRPTLSQLLTGRNKTINNQLLAKLDENFPDLDIVWLLFGRGMPRTNANIKTSELENSASEPSKEPQPTVSEQLKAQGYDNNVETPKQANYAAEPQWRASVICTPSEPTPEPAQAPAEPLRREEAQAEPKSEPRHITNIIIFYSDNSFETFKPA